ncbi:MAG: YopX family protein [Methanothermobacter sp.]
MKREIKLRVWTGKQMIYPSEINDYDLSYNRTGNWSLWKRKEEESKLICNEIDNPEMELLEYTGLKDINDKEIYEGDILDISRIFDGRDHDIVIFKYGGFALKQEFSTDFLVKICNSFKIVGNIYEKPELLK